MIFVYIILIFLRLIFKCFELVNFLYLVFCVMIGLIKFEEEVSEIVLIGKVKS